MSDDVNCLVVFEHRHARGPMRLLRPGFRHCFCLLDDHGVWLICDPLKGSIVLETVHTDGFLEIARHFTSTGREVLAGVRPSPTSTKRRVRLLTCVEIVKRLIGVDAPCVVTPYQLFRHLQQPDARGCRFRRHDGGDKTPQPLLDFIQ